MTIHVAIEPESTRRGGSTRQSQRQSLVEHLLGYDGFIKRAATDNFLGDTAVKKITAVIKRHQC